MDLIEKDKLIEILAEMQGRCATKAALVQNSKIWRQVKDMPTVEAEPIRCKDCVHGSGDIFKTGIVCAKILSATNCDVIDAVVPKDHYCGWGRKEE